MQVKLSLFRYKYAPCNIGDTRYTLLVVYLKFKFYCVLYFMWQPWAEVKLGASLCPVFPACAPNTPIVRPRIPTGDSGWLGSQAGGGCPYEQEGQGQDPFLGAQSAVLMQNPPESPPMPDAEERQSVLGVPCLESCDRYYVLGSGL